MRLARAKRNTLNKRNEMLCFEQGKQMPLLHKRSNLERNGGSESQEFESIYNKKAFHNIKVSVAYI